eukprot:01944_3
MAYQASAMYSTNLQHLLHHMGGAPKWSINMDDEVVRPMVVAHQKSVTFPPPRVVNPSPAAPAQPKPQKTAAKAAAKVEDASVSPAALYVTVIAFVATFILIAMFFPKSFPSHLMVFTLACIVGYNSIWSVAPALHTPLMSASNAISGVVILGGIVQVDGGLDTATLILSALAVLVASINVCGGFWVTHRMLNMFIIEEPAKKSGGYEQVRD